MSAIFFGSHIEIVMKKQIKSARETKEEKVNALVTKFQRAKTLTFADYRGLTANQVAALREKIKVAGGEMLVEKNTLTKLALKSTGHTIAKENDPDNALLTGPTATIIAYDDEIAPIKESAQSNKETGLPIFKFGFFGHDFLNSKAVESLSKIPQKNVLQASLVGSLSSPIYGIVTVLGANLRNLVYTIDQIKNQKQAS